MLLTAAVEFESCTIVCGNMDTVLDEVVADSKLLFCAIHTYFVIFNVGLPQSLSSYNPKQSLSVYILLSFIKQKASLALW